MNYCAHCGRPIVKKMPEGDDRERFICESCDIVYYQNPKMVVGCLPVWEDKILMIRRAIEPRHGKWTLPAGYLENGETVLEGAVRETLEEAGARVVALEPYTLYHVFPINQIYMLFRARLANMEFSVGHESSSVRLFEESDIPWDELAFKVVEKTLRQYFIDLPHNLFPFHIGDIHLDPKLMSH